MNGPFFFEAYGCPFYVMGLSTSYIFEAYEWPFFDFLTQIFSFFYGGEVLKMLVNQCFGNLNDKKCLKSSFSGKQTTEIGCKPVFRKKAKIHDQNCL